MEYEDRVHIDTPEGVELDLMLAGLGSRFVATLIDGAFKLALVVAVGLALGLTTSLDDGGGLAMAFFFLALFGVTVLYDVLFETLASGRTPGKRLSGMRVVVQGGHPVTLLPSAVRNVLRLIDGPATGYAAGTIAILASKRNQRLGDMAAGTLVVRDAVVPAAARPPSRAAAVTGGGEQAASAAWDLTGVSADEVAAVRSFLERRYQLDDRARARVARQLADGLRAKVPGAARNVPAERFLEQLSTAKAQRG